MAAPTDSARVATNISTAATSHAINVGSPVAGTLLIVFVRFAAAPGTVTFTGYSSFGGPDTSDATDDTTQVFWRFADGTEGSTDTMSTANSVKLGAICWEILGAVNATPAISTVAIGTTAANSANPNSVAPSGAPRDTLYLALAGGDGEVGAYTAAPTNYTNLATANSGTGGNANTNVLMGGASRQITSSSSDDPGAFTHAAHTTGWTAYTVAIRDGNDSATGVRATATAAGRPGTPRVSVTGVRATATAAEKIGSARITTYSDWYGPIAANVSITGVRALATAVGRAGTPKVSLLGVRASATAAGKSGTPRISVTGTRAAGTAAGRAGTPRIAVTGTRATATAAAKAGTPKVAVSGTRALATAAGKLGAVSIVNGAGNVSITGVRALANTNHTQPTLTEAQAATLTSGLNVHDGTVMAKGMLFGITNTTPARIVKWADPTDLSTFTSQTFANDGKHIGSSANCIVYDANADLLYVCFSSHIDELGGDNFHVLISSVDPDSISTIANVSDVDTGSTLSQGACAMVLISGFLYVLTAPSLENARLFKVDPSDGSVDASLQLTGANRVRGHGFGTDGTRLYFAGTRNIVPPEVWVGWADLDFSAHDTLTLGTGLRASDDITVVGDSFFVNAEQETVPSGTVKKIKKDLSSSTDVPIGFATGVDGQYYDGQYLWVTSNGEYAGGVTGKSVLVALEPATGAVATRFPLSVTHTNEILPFTNSLLLVTFNTPAEALRLSLSTAAAPPAGTPKVDVSGVRALASATGKPGTVTTSTGATNATVTGVRATATAVGRPGTPKVSVTGTRASATAAGVPGTPKVSVTATRALATATGTPGTPRLSLLGVRATATAAAKAGTPKVSLLGVRAAASAAGRPGTPRIAVTGVRALATATGKAGSTSAPGNKTVTGVRATATAAGRAGTPRIAVTGTRATGTATGTAGTPRLSLLGVRATATAAGRAGTPKVSLLGVRALANAAGREGTPRIAVTGTRALATASGKAGATTAPGNKSVTGVRALATATGRSGTPRISVTGTRGLATASGRPGTPKVAVTGTRASATATGKPGTLARINPSILGTRALCTAAGKAGSPKIGVSGTRGTCTAAGRPGTPKVGVTGVRAACAATGRGGTFRLHVVGARAECTASGNAGFNGIPGLPVLTKRSRFSAPSASTILATRNGRTRVSLRSSSTRTHTPPVEDD